MKKAKRKVTLSLDSETYGGFKKFCEENAIMLSKKVELIMRDILNNNGNNGNSNNLDCFKEGIIQKISNLKEETFPKKEERVR